MTIKAKEFIWGDVIRTHEIGDDYEIIEYHPNQPVNRTDEEWETAGGDGQIRFHIERVGDWKGLSRSYRTFDAALLGAVIARNEARHFGVNAALNEQLTSYLVRMLRIEEPS